MKVITMLNEKGGVAKTTLATHLAAGLAMRGYRALLVDADPQGSASLNMGLDVHDGIYRWLIQGESPNSVIHPVHPDAFALEDTPGFLGVIRSNVTTRNIAQSTQDFTLFHQRVQQLSDVMDYVIVDTSPTPSLLHAMLILGSDFVLIPTQLETPSISGVRNTVEHLKGFFTQKQQLLGKGIGLLGIIPTMTQMATVEHGENYDILLEDYGGYVWHPIARRIAWSEAATFCQPVWMLDGAGKAGNDAFALLDHMMGVLDGVEA